MGQAGRLNLKLINDYEERKAFSLVSSINNTQKNLHDPMALRARDISSKESPLGMHEINDLRFLAQQQKKMIKAGVNIDNLFLDGGTGGPGKISIGSAVHSKKPSYSSLPSKQGHKRSSSEMGKNAPVDFLFRQRKPGSKFFLVQQPGKPAEMMKSESKGHVSDHYLQNPVELRKKTASVEPPRAGPRPGEATYQIHFARQSNSQAAVAKLKANNYLASQELKKSLE